MVTGIEIASAKVRVQPDFTGFAAASQLGIRKGISSTAASARRLGGTLTAAVTLPVVALGAVAIKTFAGFDKGRIENDRGQPSFRNSLSPAIHCGLRLQQAFFPRDFKRPAAIDGFVH